MTVNRKLQGWCLKGPLRRAIIKSMFQPMTLIQLRKRITNEYKSVSLSNISDAVRLMARKGVCVCYNPEEKCGRLYDLSEAGRLVREEIMRV